MQQNIASLTSLQQQVGAAYTSLVGELSNGLTAKGHKPFDRLMEDAEPVPVEFQEVEAAANCIMRASVQLGQGIERLRRLDIY